MASDWIKMRKELPTDPAVMHIAKRLGLSPYTVVGKLYRLWCWADTYLQKTGGVAKGVPVEWVDRHVESKWFGFAMIEAGWLERYEDGIRFPNWDKHLSDAAKKRALTQRRQHQYYKEGRGNPQRWKPKRVIVLKRDCYTCVYCGAPATAVDHVVPKVRGGSHELDNLVAACKPCNSRKGGRTPEQAGMTLRRSP